MPLKKLVLLLFLAIAAWQDFKKLSIKLWVYIVFGMLGFCINFLQHDSQTTTVLFSCIFPGFFLLLLHKVSRGTIGAGDGWFFIVSGLFLNIKENLYLLCYGLLLCSFWCVILVIWGMVKGISMRNCRIPFLPFLFPVGIWLVNI